MTQVDFFSYVKLYPNLVNVWYSDNGSPYTIYGLSIPVLDKNNEDSTTYLSQVEEVSFPLLNGSLDHVTLKVRQRFYGISSNVGYYLLLVDPYIVQTIGNTLIPNATALLSPSLDVSAFADSPYNVLGGSIEDARQSAYIMQSDRYKVGTLTNPTYTGPLNIDNLLSGSATRASVQDSLYSSLSWVRSRYDGAKTSRVDYKTDPALAGSLFKGADFASGSDPKQISYLISSSQVDYKDFFYAGKGDIPGFDTGIYTGMKYLQGYAATDVKLRITSANIIGNPPYKPYEGDLIVNSKNSSSPEIIKVTGVSTVLGFSPVTYSLDVMRGYLSTPDSISSGLSVTKVAPVQIYNIDNNKLSGVPKGLIIVKETGKTLGIDSLGYVVSST